MGWNASEKHLIVTHQAILRCIYAYFIKKTRRKSPWLNVPCTSADQVTPRAVRNGEASFQGGVRPCLPGESKAVLRSMRIRVEGLRPAWTLSVARDFLLASWTLAFATASRYSESGSFSKTNL